MAGFSTQRQMCSDPTVSSVYFFIGASAGYVTAPSSCFRENLGPSGRLQRRSESQECGWCVVRRTAGTRRTQRPQYQTSSRTWNHVWGAAVLFRFHSFYLSHVQRKFHVLEWKVETTADVLGHERLNSGVTSKFSDYWRIKGYMKTFSKCEKLVGKIHFMRNQLKNSCFCC